MKKNLYFIISSISIILLNIYSIISCNKIVESMIKSIGSLPSESMKEKVLDIYMNNGNTYVITIAIISMLLSALMLISIYRKTVTKRKFAILSVLGILIAPIDLITFISFLNLLLCITIQNDIITKVEIPKLEYKVDKKYIINSIILIAVYLSQYLIKFIPINYNSKYILSILMEVILLVLAIILFIEPLKNELETFKNNFKSYIKYIMPKLGIAYIIYIVVSLIVSSITKQTTSVNQQSLEQLSIWYIIPAAIVWAPIVEEALFRRCIRNFIKSDKIFIIVSALIFGLLHTTSEATLTSFFLMGLPYITLGGYLAYIFTKTNNMFSNMFSHMFINAIALILMLIGL